jgi:exonuclease SbcD
MIRVAHTADWHLNAAATFAGSIVRDGAGANLRWRDQMTAVRAVVDGILASGAQLAIIAGDLWDKPKPGIAEIVFAQQEIYRLSDRVTTVVIPGNHDVATGDDPSPVATLDCYNPALHIVTRPQVIRPNGVSIACLPFPTRGMLLAKPDIAGLSHEAVNTLLSEKLRAIVRSLRAQCAPDLPAFLVAHLPIVGAALNPDQTAGQEHVSLTKEDLEGWDLVCLGDLHLRQQVTARAYYPGSTARNGFGEQHYQPGWLLHTLDGDTLTTETMEIPSRRWVTMEPGELAPSEPIDGTVYRVTGTVSQEELDALQPALARWRTSPLFSEALEVTRQTRARSETVTADLSPPSALAEWAALQGKESELAAMLAVHGELVK